MCWLVNERVSLFGRGNYVGIGASRSPVHARGVAFLAPGKGARTYLRVLVGHVDALRVVPREIALKVRCGSDQKHKPWGFD